MAEEARYSEGDARLIAAELRIKHRTGNIQAEEDGDAWVVAKHEGGKRYVLTKPQWRAVNA